MTGLSARFPYSQGDVVRLTEASMPQVKKLAKKFLRKKGKGSGKHLGFNLDDMLRIAVARDLLRVGVDVASLHELFAAIDRPQLSTAHPWAWLRTADCVSAALVLIHAPRNAPFRTGAVYLTTAIEAVALLKSHQTVTVIDVGAHINRLEEQTGERYTEQPSATNTDPKDVA